MNFGLDTNQDKSRTGRALYWSTNGLPQQWIPCTMTLGCKYLIKLIRDKLRMNNFLFKIVVQFSLSEGCCVDVAAIQVDAAEEPRGRGSRQCQEGTEAAGTTGQ